MMNNQQAFSKVVRHLRKQGKKAGSGLACFYRTNEGLKCAIGCLIPDSMYDVGMERQPVTTILNWYPNLPFRYVERNLLTRLQELHDMYTASGWERRIEELAKEFDLKVPKK